uniref:branched-chain amino acid transport system II carrier protein n=1 Tax=Thaumasiovibrio occultus TaxID=1891184 RepID=UPI000B35308B|nr:branched-chain amino acid transport system II carrier protein [Thaumasiovibrio occultus]
MLLHPSYYLFIILLTEVKLVENITVNYVLKNQQLAFVQTQQYIKEQSVKKSLSVVDIFALGFMTFAFFLGAGNIIFPPQAGLSAGTNYLPAMMGFLVTAVGLPLLGIVAVGVGGDGWKGLTRHLPVKVSTLMAVLIFIIIGPAFAAPRAGLVAYEMGVVPFLGETNQWMLAAFSAVFFGISLLFCWSQGKLVDMIGKVLTPVLFIGLAILAVSVFVAPQSEIVAPIGAYQTQAFTTGLLDGYNTMDTFAALMFGMLIVDLIRKRGIDDAGATCKYLIMAGVIAAVGLAFVYISLFYLGATSSAVAAGANNGGAILAAYVQALFGPMGQVILSSIVLLACLTTVIGLTGAASDYFSSLTSLSYRTWAIILSVTCAVVANVGLAQLIAISVPVLVALYPVAIALIVLTFLKKYFARPAMAYGSVLAVSLVFSFVDALKAISISPEGWPSAIQPLGEAMNAGLQLVNTQLSVLSFLPGFSSGMSWLLPTVAVIVLNIVAVRRAPQLGRETTA